MIEIGNLFMIMMGNEFKGSKYHKNKEFMVS